MSNNDLTEQETRSRHITPALQRAGWPSKRIRQEYAFTDGRIIERGGGLSPYRCVKVVTE